jgi:glycosyltransferase involved in cell wall biosynthesis
MEWVTENIRLAFLAGGGESVHARKWLTYFVGKGYDVHLITFTGKPIKGVNVHKLRYFSKLAYPFRILEVKKAVKEINPDILHAHYVSHYGVYGALTDFKPFVVTAWGSDVLIDPEKSLIKKYVVRYVLRKADLITCDAEHMREAMRRLGGVPEKISLINFGIDTRKFSPSEKSEKLRAELGIYDSPTVISLRNLNPLYDIESLIKSIPFVLKEVPESKFVIAGRGSEETKLKELAKSLGVSGNTKFVGFIPNDELPQYLTSMNVYVSTALSDAGLSACTAEAMACGLPVIITDVADNKKWVEDGVNGFIVPIKDPKSLAERIIYLLKNEHVRMKFGKISRKIIEERNDYYKEMGKMESIYEELAERYRK